MLVSHTFHQTIEIPIPVNGDRLILCGLSQWKIWLTGATSKCHNPFEKDQRCFPFSLSFSRAAMLPHGSTDGGLGLLSPILSNETTPLAECGRQNVDSQVGVMLFHNG